MSSAGIHVRRAASFWGTADTTLRVNSVLWVLRTRVSAEGRAALRVGAVPMEEQDERSRSMKDAGFPEGLAI